jgi:hypothetical protein
LATVIHDDFLDAMLGNPTHSVIDFNADNIDVSLLDETDSGTITASFVDYDEVDAATVVATTDVASITIGVVATGALDAADTTFSSVTGDAADFLSLWKNSGTPATSPLAVTWDSATTGLPVTPNGGDIVSTWNASGLITLT